MKLRALITIKYGGRYREPGQVFDCGDFEVVQYLIGQAAAEPIETVSAGGENDAGLPNQAETDPDRAGLTAGTEVKQPIQVSEPLAPSDPPVTMPADPDPETWTKKQIKEALDRAGVEYDGRVGKQKLLKLLKGLQ